MSKTMPRPVVSHRDFVFTQVDHDTLNTKAFKLYISVLKAQHKGISSKVLMILVADLANVY